MPSQESTVHGHFERKPGNPVAYCSGFLCATEPHGFGKVGVANILQVGVLDARHVSTTCEIRFSLAPPPETLGSLYPIFVWPLSQASGYDNPTYLTVAFLLSR